MPKAWASWEQLDIDVICDLTSYLLLQIEDRPNSGKEET